MDQERIAVIERRLDLLVRALKGEFKYGPLGQPIPEGVWEAAWEAAAQPVPQWTFPHEWHATAPVGGLRESGPRD